MEGFKRIEWSGLWDMPKRVGDIYYDWGDELEPLVDAEDIVWDSREFTLKALFDKRITGKTFEQKKQEIKALEKFTLQTPYRVCDVSIVEFRVIYENSLCAVCEFDFYEQKPTFETNLPVKTNTGTTIDGYSLQNDLGIYSVFKSNIELGELIDERTTVYKTGKAKSNYREFREIELHCFSADVLKIQNLLAKEGLRELSHNGIIYRCFFTDGFKVRKSTKGFHYTIKLKVYEII